MNAINLAHNQAMLHNEQQEAYQGDYLITLLDDVVVMEELDDIVLCLED